MSEEPMALEVINKINDKLKFFCRKNRFISRERQIMLGNAHNQPYFDYACPAWYPNSLKNTKKKIKIMQIKCIRFRLRLDTSHI